MAIEPGRYRDAGGSVLIVADPSLLVAGIMAAGGPMRFHSDDIASAMSLADFEMLIVSEKGLADAGYALVE